MPENEKIISFVVDKAEECAQNMIRERNDLNNVQFWRGALAFADQMMVFLNADPDNVVSIAEKRPGNGPSNDMDKPTG